MEIKRDEIAAALERAPALKPLLTRFARAAAKGSTLPQTFTAKGIDYAAQRELDGLLKLPTVRDGAGKVCGTLPTSLREPAAWREAVALLLPEAECAPKAECADDFFRKLHWEFSEYEPLIAALEATPEIRRFVARPENRSVWSDLLDNVLQYVERAVEVPTTLSQLGSDWFNDSKALRAGPLRRQLYLLLAVISGRDTDERAAFGAYGIFDNPYTSFVTVFAPFAFTTDDGRVYDFPHKLHKAGLAVTLPSETVQHIRRVEWFGKVKSLVTSENAAPFARYVAARRPCLYTEGYPNYAVQRLLAMFGKAGVSAEHAGDADLDGFVIAAMVSRTLSVTRVCAAEIAERPGDVPGIPLTDDQRERLATYVARFPKMVHAPSLRQLLARGCWYEQEAFPL